MCDGVGVNYSLLNSPSNNRSRFELPTINVKEESPRLMNRYRDKRNMVTNLSVDYRNFTTSNSPVRLREEINNDI